ncbi:hypothetical protein NDU88_005534 [Pleurodeles waltl]|uniref:Uncharacterized protein n=1 Tax=Pleurodeles waltl TaxID=8319 RepID=A0AAV7MAR8_PLEWA|nr:hypothetical protein NDU88_005534 [Pleurodeles waltl]
MGALTLVAAEIHNPVVRGLMDPAVSEACPRLRGDRQPGSESGELRLPPPADLLPRSDRSWLACPASEGGPGPP